MLLNLFLEELDGIHVSSHSSCHVDSPVPAIGCLLGFSSFPTSNQPSFIPFPVLQKSTDFESAWLLLLPKLILFNSLKELLIYVTIFLQILDCVNITLESATAPSAGLKRDLMFSSFFFPEQVRNDVRTRFCRGLSNFIFGVVSGCLFKLTCCVFRNQIADNSAR